MRRIIEKKPGKQNETVGREAKAGFTIEAAVIIPVVFILTVCVIFAAFSLHDNVLMKTVSAEVGLQKSGEIAESESEITEEIKEKLKNRLVILKEKDIGIKAAINKNSCTITVNGHIGMPGLSGEDILPENLKNIDHEINTDNTKARETLNLYKAACDGLENTGLLKGNED